MTYSEATGSFESDFLEQIFDTEYKYNVPYKIDREKYVNLLNEYNQENRIKDADVFSFHYSFHKSNIFGDEDDDPSYAFFAWPQNSPEESKDFYDCFQSYRFNDSKEEFEAFVRKVLECIIEPDKVLLLKLKVRLINDIVKIENNIADIDTILNSNGKG